MHKSHFSDEFIARKAEQAGEVYATMPNGRNVTLNQCAVPSAPTVSSNADMTNELHNRLSQLEEDLHAIHQRIGAEHGAIQGRSPDKLTEGNGPLDFTAEQLVYALVRIDNMRTIVGTISARI